MDCIDFAVGMDVSSGACTPSIGSSSSAKLPSQSEVMPKVEETPETHKCPYKACGKFFSKKYNLKAHLRLHTGEQPFECPRPDCDKKFKWRSSLSSHSVWHTRKDAGIAVGNVGQDGNAVPKSKTPFGTSPITDLSTISALEMSRKGTTISQAHPLGKKPVPKKKRPRAARSKASRIPSAITASAVSNMDVNGAEAPFDKQDGGQGPTKKRKQLAANVKNVAAMQPMVVPSVIDSIAAAWNANAWNVSMDTSSAGDASAAIENQIFDGLPGSPVTSDGDNSEKSLDCELFNGTLLPPLSSITGGGSGKDLLLEEGDVDAILGDTAELFPCASPSNGALQGVDTRFGPFELDNLQGFCAGKVEGL